MELFTCPHCNIYIQVPKKQFNCKIFRCGIYKNNYKQINPHMKKNKCDYLIQNNLIYGCAKPFKIIQNNNSFTTIKCNYI